MPEVKIFSTLIYLIYQKIVFFYDNVTRSSNFKQTIQKCVYNFYETFGSVARKLKSISHFNYLLNNLKYNFGHSRSKLAGTFIYLCI